MWSIPATNPGKDLKTMNADFNENTHQCIWCENDAKVCCGCCKKVWYCSREHQRLHWNDHFEDCPNFHVKASPEVGQYTLASRNMKASTLIIKDFPIIIGPLANSGLICLSCHVPINHDNFSKCPDCSWPMCSLECASAEEHDNECDILSRDEKLCGVPQTQRETPRYDLILLLRCLLLKKHNPEMWNLVLTMVSHGSRLKEGKDPYQIAAVRYFSEICKVDIDVDTIHHIRGVILANVLKIRGPKGSFLRALYPKIRLMNHSCLPNVHLASDLEGNMEARAAINIKKGEELFICYTGTDEPLWSRQACLLDNHYFNCLCSRCLDPSELNSHFSSVKCPACPQKVMVPSLNEGILSWKCPKCETQCSVEEVKQEIEDWLFRLEMNDLFGSGTPFKIAHALSTIELNFHSKHFLWLRTGQAALHKLAHNEIFSAMKLKKYIWENILDIYDIIEPGLTRRRGMTLIQLAKANLNLANRDFEEQGEISRYQVESFLREAERRFSESHKILRFEPAGTPENILAKDISYQISFILQELGELL